MTTFKEISGQLIRTLSSDPANPQIGQIWYNSTIGVLKGYENIGGAWASGASMATGRYSLASAGTQTAALGSGGYSSILGDETTATEEYDGSTWTAGGNLGTAKYGAFGAGTQTAAFSAAGNDGTGAQVNTTENYDGTSWSPSGNVNTTRTLGAAAGTQSAGLAIG